LSKIQEIKKNERGGPFYHSNTLKKLISLKFSLSQGLREVVAVVIDIPINNSNKDGERGDTQTHVNLQGYTTLSPFLSPADLLD